MRKHTILLLVTFLMGSSAFADGNPFKGTQYKAMQPVSTIPAGSKITLGQADSKTIYFTPGKTANSSSGFQNYESGTVRPLTSLSNSSDDGELNEIKGAVEGGTLTMQKDDFNAEDSGCFKTGSCTLKHTTAVYQSGSFNFFDWIKDLFGFNKVKSLVTPVDKTSPNVVSEMALNGITDTQEKLSGEEQKACETLPPDKLNDRRFQCGLKMAQQAFQKAKDQGKTTSDTFIFNDFGKGELQGKMYFFNSSGALVNVVDKNPIPVIRGQGKVNKDGKVLCDGFGNVKGFNGTPDGAIVTAPYTGKRDGSITDGIDLDGLEPSNRNLRTRKILMHGWDTYTSPGTAGCLGVDGTITLNAPLGGLPAGVTRSTKVPYLDMMKERLLRGNRVFIYNFTPNKVREGLCP